MERIPTHTHTHRLPERREKGVCREERRKIGAGRCPRLGHRWCRPYRVVNQDINQCYGAWDGIRYLWFEACWQGSASPES